MDPVAFMLVMLGISVLAGTLGALLGIGGGMILVPFLTIFMHVDMHLAIGASIVSVIATSSGSTVAYLRDRITNVRIGMFLEIGTTIGAIAGATIAAYMNASALSLVFGLVLIYSAWQMFANRRHEHRVIKSSPMAERMRLPGTYHDRVLDQEVTYGVTGVLPGLSVMGLAGALSGMLGIGSGAFKVLAMDLLMKLPMKVSTTTSNLMIGVTAAASAGIYFFRGDINPYLAGPVALGVLLGSMIGTRLLLRLQSARIRQLFVIVLLVLAIQMVWKGGASLLGGLHG